MPPKSKDSRLRLGEPAASELAAYRRAMGQGVTEIGIVRDAVQAFIRAQTKHNKELRERYESELQAVRSETPLRAIK